MVAILVYYNCKIELKQSAILNELWFCFGLVPTCKRLVPGAIPSINLPEKSIPSTSTTAPRRELVRQEPKPKPSYSSLEDFKKKVEKLS